MREDVAIHLLGGFSMLVGERPVVVADFERRAGAELIQLLALAPGRRLHREQVIDALWPDAELASGMKRLNKACTFARNAAAARDAIVVKDEVVALFPDRDLTVDVELIERADASDADSIDVAVAAYSGDLLPENPYADWIAPARQRLRHQLLELLAAAHRWTDLLELDETREEAHVALMHRDLERGNAQRVIDRFEFLEEKLASSLGVVPGRAAVSLRDQARRLLDEAGGGGFRAVVAVDPGARSGGDLAWIESLAERSGAEVLAGPEGFWLEFSSAEAAVDGAGRLLDSASRHLESSAAPRLGVDAGLVDAGVLERSRALAQLAGAGQALLSGLAIELARTGASDGQRLTDLGLVDVPGHRPMVLHRLSVADADSPSEPFTGRRLDGQPVGALPDRVVIGRERERTELLELVRNERLVTVTGPGGAGKTHLVRAVAAAAVNDFDGGAWWASLGSSKDVGAARQLVLDAVGGQQHGDADVEESICRTLGARATLVVLDNCEHLAEPIASLVASIIDRCPGTTVLATSRIDLGLGVEVAYPLGSLEGGDAVDLFVAEAVRRGVHLDRSDPSIHRICKRLDGLPLAIRLAAGRARSLELSVLASMLDESLDVLATAEDEVLDHQQTLHTTMAWSYELLPPDLRTTLSDLAVLAGPFDLDAAIAVADRGGGRALVAERLDRLVRHSLVIGPARGEGRYRLLESIRTFAAAEAVDESAILRHLDHFVAGAESAHRLKDEDSDAALEWFRSNWDDLRQARANASEQGRLDDLCRLINALMFHCMECSIFEVVDWCEEDLGSELRGDSRVRALALAAWALLLLQRTERERAIAVLERVDPAYRQLPHARYVAVWIAWTEGDLETTRSELESLSEERGEHAELRAMILVFLAIVSLADGGSAAEPAFELEVLAAGRGAGYRCMAMIAKAIAANSPDASMRHLAECRELADAHRLTAFGGSARGSLAAVLAGGIADHVGRADPSFDTRDRAASVHEGIRWTFDRGQWLHCLSAVGSAADLLELKGRADLAVTIRSGRQANGFATTYSALLAADLRAAMRDTYGERTDQWWEAGERLSSREVAMLAMHGLEEIFGLTPSGVGG